ncbi:MAG TPA: ATP-binding protein [Tissierellaceae bacterium]|nr:ATP-binding protein [Tissierellaceae bacterium]
MLEKYKVPIKQLENRCDPNIFPYETTEDIKVDRELIGQDRAMEALKYGISMKPKGYNIYVSGLSGSGKNSYSYIVAKEFAKKQNTPKDWIYVYNFNKPNSPNAISIETGKGKVFKNEVEEAIKKIEEEIPKAINSRDFEDKKNKIFALNKKMADDVLEELNEFAKEYNFLFKRTDKGLMTIPLLNGEPMTDKELGELPEEEMEKLGSTSRELTGKSYDYIKKIKNIEVKLLDELEKLKEEMVSSIATKFIDSIEIKYKENKNINQFLKEMKEDIVDNYEMFIGKKEEKNYLAAMFSSKSSKSNFLKRYVVNLFIDNSNTKGAPIVREMNPNYFNLFGKIEYVNELGVAKTDHTKIKSGSLHEANGGYIILQAKDILQNPLSWDSLKRSLTTEEIKIENVMAFNIASETLDPESIPLDVKIIIIGDNYIYHALYNFDDDFKKLFKIRADFDTEMERNKENILKIGSFVAYQCKEENLLPFHRKALARIIDLSSRIAGDKNKLTARFNEVVEILYEADGWASSKGKKIVNKEDIEKAISKKEYRNNIYEEKILELIKDETLIIDTYGEKVGEINGLAVIDLGQYAFGRPTKITANTYFGKDGIINIEKEVEQSGSIHDKGVLILSGYLGEKYAQEIQLSLTASITFEQSYEGIDGDSASSTELYALLSSLGELPIKQGTAVTGSVNQKGRIQPIGGVNEKIEGYYNICKIKGFKGGEGVIIPRKNLKNLILDEEIINAVKEKIFTIYAIDTIDEGMEILTGLEAGKLEEDGLYEKNTINRKVQDKLNHYAKINEELGE